MNRIALECASNNYTVSQMISGLVLPIQVVHQPSGVVVERQFFTRRPLLRALGGLGEGFVRAAVTIDDDAGPRSGTGLIVLPNQRDAGTDEEPHGIHPRTVR